MISLIVAVDAEFGIGKHGQIPWHYTEDMKHFAKTTRGSTCIMGRITCEDILQAHDSPQLLPSRETIVITRDASFQARDAIVASSLQEAINKASRDNIFIIGGASLYIEALPHIDKAYITFIPGTHGCDVKISEAIEYVMKNFDCTKNVSSDTGLEFTEAIRIN